MRTIFAIILLAVASVGYGQCENGSCGIGGCSGGSCPTGGCGLFRPRQEAQVCKYPALVHVDYVQGNTAMGGTGTVVDETRNASVILSYAHGYTAISKVVVTDQTGQRYSGTMIGIDSLQDVAIIATANMHIAPMAIANTHLNKGDSVWMAGFAGGTRYLATRGVVQGYVSPSRNGENTFLQTTCHSEEGCSGGPYINAAGEIVGTVTCGNGRDSTGPCLWAVLESVKCKPIQ